MKSVLFIAIFISAHAHAATLKCWDRYAARGEAPMVRALVASDSVLRNLVVRSEPTNRTGDLNIRVTSVTGAMITTRRSPYVGRRDFKFNGLRMILPARLDQASLSTLLRSEGENGVIIGSSDPDLIGDFGAGVHFSFRLRCRLYER